MSNVQSQISDYAKILDLKEKEILLKQNEVSEFLSTTHDAKATEDYLEAVRKTEAEITGIMLSLVEIRNTKSEFKEEANNLCARGASLKVYTRDAKNDLSGDLKEQHRKAEKKAVDFIKIGTFLLFFPVMLVAAAKNLLGNENVNGAGLTVGGSLFAGFLAFHPKIIPAWKIASAAVCNKPKQIKNSFLVYYMNDIARERKDVMVGVIQNGAENTSKVIKKLFNRKPPAP